MKRTVLLGVSVLLLLSVSQARADSRKACVEAADHGQELRDKGKLNEARQAFVTCARDECPALVARQCVTWLSEVEHDVPTVNIRARDGQGKDLIDVAVSVDGVQKVASLDGRPMQLDPGVHKFHYAHSGDPDVDQDIVVRSGEKDRILDVRFSAKAATAEPAQTQSTPPPVEAAPKSGFHFPVFAGVMLGVGIASFVGMGVLIGTTASDVNQMHATCGITSSCSQSDVDWANTRIILANVAMGVGIAGVGLSVLSLIIANVGHSSSSSRSAWELRVGPGQVGLSRMF